MIANPKTVVLEQLLQELRTAGNQWRTQLDAKLQDSTYNRGKSAGSEHVSLEAYVDALTPHCVIALRQSPSSAVNSTSSRTLWLPSTS